MNYQILYFSRSEKINFFFNFGKISSGNVIIKHIVKQTKTTLCLEYNLNLLNKQICLVGQIPCIVLSKCTKYSVDFCSQLVQ